MQTATEQKATRRAELLKDRRAYRETLINRKEEIERKIKAVEQEISQIQKRS